MNINFSIVFTIIALYFGAILGSLLWSRFKTTGSIVPGVEEFFMAKKSLPTPVLVLTYIGTLFSAFTILGLPGFVFSHGIGGVLFVFAADLLALAIMFYFAIKIRRYAQKYDLISPVALLRHSYSSIGLGVFSTILFVAFVSPYLSLQLVGLGKLLEVISHGDITYLTGVGTTLAIVLVYVLFGGMRTVAYTDVVQTIMIFLGMSIGSYILISHYWGGVPQLFETVKTNYQSHLSLPGPKGLFTNKAFFGYVIATTGVFFLPHVVTRFMMARDDKQVKSVIKITVVGVVISLSLALLMGLMAVVLHPELENSNAVGGLIFSDLSVIGTAGSIAAMMLLIGVLGASMSTADSILLSISQMVTRDVIKPFWEPSEKQQVFLARFIMAVVLGLAFWIGMNPPTLMIDLALYAGKGAGLFIPLYLGMWWAKRNAYAAMAGITMGTIVLLYLGLNGIKPFGFDGSLWAWLTSAVIFVVGSFLLYPTKKGT